MPAGIYYEPVSYTHLDVYKRQLLAWGEELKPVAKMAFEGKGEQNPGEWCHYCRAKHVCRACMDAALSLAREEFLDLDDGILADTAEETDVTAPYNPDESAPVFKAPGLVSFPELVADVYKRQVQVVRTTFIVDGIIVTQFMPEIVAEIIIRKRYLLRIRYVFLPDKDGIPKIPMDHLHDGRVMILVNIRLAGT